LLIAQTGCFKTRSQLRQEEKVQEIQTQLDSMQSKRADGNSNIDGVKSILARLNGRLEEIEHVSRSDRQKIRNEFNSESQSGAERSIERDQRMARMEQKLAILIDQMKALSDEWRTYQKNQKSKANAVVRAKKGKNNKSSKKLYNDGLDNFKAKKYTKAIASFKKAIQKSSRGPYAPGSHYHLAESYVSKSKMEDAILEYSQVFENFPKSYWAPHATYKLGLSFKKLGKKSEAKKFFLEVTNTYPNTNEAKKAKREIQKL